MNICQCVNSLWPNNAIWHHITWITSVQVMMTSSNGNFSALLAFCAGNSPVTGEFPTQRPVTRSFDVFFDLRLNKRLSKQWWGCVRKISLWSVDYIFNQSTPNFGLISNSIEISLVGQGPGNGLSCALSLDFTRTNADLFLIRNTGLENTCVYVNGLMQEKCNSIANTLELCLFFH